MKKFYLLLLMLVISSFSAQALVSYRFGVDAGVIGGVSSGGYSLTVSPIQLQLSPSFQLGLGGFGIYNYAIVFSEEDIKQEIIKNKNDYDIIDIEDVGAEYNYKNEMLIPLISLKYDAVQLTLGKNWVPFIKASTFLSGFDNFSPQVGGDAKAGLSIYSRQRGVNLSFYIGATYGLYTCAEHELFGQYSYDSKGTTKYGNYSSSFDGCKLPLQFNFGLMFEFGGKGAWGYGKMANCTKAERKALRSQRLDNWATGLNAAGGMINLTADIVNTTSHSGSSGGGYSQSSGSSSSKSNNNYQTQYDRLESNAKQIYENLLTISQKSNSFVSKNATLRKTQDEMATIRKKANRNGVTLRKSIYETVVVKAKDVDIDVVVPQYN